MRIAFLGTGIMDGPMASNLAAAGHDVTVWNRTREKAGGLGAAVAGTPAEAVAGAEVVIMMLTDAQPARRLFPSSIGRRCASGPRTSGWRSRWLRR